MSKRRRPGFFVHKDCYHGPHENEIKWKEIDAGECPPICNYCGLPGREGQVMGLVPVDLITEGDPLSLVARRHR